MTHVRSFAPVLLAVAAIVLLVSLGSPSLTHADSTADIKAQISDRNKQIANLQAEIASYQKQLDALGTQHQTLATSIQSIDISRSKISAKIALLSKQIDAANGELRDLNAQMQDKEQSISLDKETLAKSLRDIDTNDNVSLIEQVLSSDSLADAWTAADTLASVGEALRAHANALSVAKVELAAQQDQVAQTKDQLSSLTTNLSGQKGALDANKTAKQQLLNQTKAQESQYQKLIATKKAQEAAFEAELNQLESQLTSVGTASIPHPGSGILAWPFSSSLMQECATRVSIFGNQFCVTQYFGNTAFAASGAYSGKGHNGIDIGVPVGTPVQAALSGTVMGTGNTDLSHSSSGAQCYSFGKWVAIKHANGLATVYAHLSVISVSRGQTVLTGDVIGYSGMTGYATGPHLHFGVYALGTPDAPGIQIMTLNQFKGANTPCANATMPVAPLNAYLNPMSYL